MMSSVIPARLQFQCGHAALVTLPRVKGESSAQRNERIAREKSAALARQCDFCGPTVRIEVSAPDGVNGNHMMAAELTAPDVETVVSEPVAALAEALAVAELEEALALEEEAVVEVEEVVVVEEPVDVVDEEPVIVIEEEPLIVVEEEPVVVIAEVLPQPVDEQPETAYTNGTVELKPARRRRAPSVKPENKPEVVTTAATQRKKFVIEYRAELVLQAADIRDALRQAAARGAVNVVAATREV